MKKLFLFLIAVLLFHNAETVKQNVNTFVSQAKHTVSSRNSYETAGVSGEKYFFEKNPAVLMRYASHYKGRDRETFFDSLVSMSKRLAFQPEWVLKTMFHESSLNPKARNTSGAAGLIQIMPETAVSLGTTTAHILRSTGTRQLQWIEKFWKPASGKVKSYTDLRLYNLFPAALGKPSGFILESPSLPARAVASRNPVFDTDRDMKITVEEFRNTVKHEK